MPLRRRLSPTKVPEYVDNGTSPMLVAERFIKENSIFKLNSRLYLYHFDNKPCYTEISDETLCEVLFEQYRDLFMREQPGLALQVCRSIRLQLKGTPKEAIIKYEMRYIALRNAIIDLKKDRVIDHTPDILLRYYLDLDVDLNDSDCTHFKSFINDAASNKNSVVKSIYEMLAYLIFPTEFKKAIFCIIGPPNSGKSIISVLLQSLFSDDCVSNESLCDLGKNFRSGNYAEARLNIDGDLPNKVIGEKEIGILKRISGGDKIVSEVKYQQSYSTNTECKFLVCSNHKLMLKSPDNAFLYRLHVIPFDNPVPRDKMDLRLSKKLEKEKTGIFTVIYKWYKLLKNNSYKFSDCVDINEYCSVYDKSQNSGLPSVIDDFFNEHFEVTGADNDFVPSSEIERLFRFFCQQNQMDFLIPGFTQRFSRFIGECYGEEIRNVRRGSNKARGYCGMRLITE